MSRHDYEEELAKLQLRLVETQEAAVASGERIVLVLEGRDGAGKDGTIKRIVEHLSVRNTHVVALPKPSDRERTQWYFQRYVAHLPSAGELVIFNRSWYNRAGVEVVMGFSTGAEQAEFLRDAPDFERMLVESGIKLVKIWLDIDKDEQERRLEARRDDPLKALQVSDKDAVAPWFCVRADKKKAARLAIIRHLLRQVAPAEVAAKVDAPDPDVLFAFEAAATKDGRLAR